MARTELLARAAMRFVDEVEIEVQAGDGGNGCIAFRREKFVPLGGPSGGDGGKGGDVVFITDPGLGTLNDLRFRRVIRADRGEHGRGSDQYGKGGKDAELRVPVGTQVFDAETNALIVDLDAPDVRHVVAKGGRGGRGNIHFATPHDRAPRRAEDGETGEHRMLRLELKLLADVGVVGFPNVGKSTFISAVSRAKPKIADYPFTTLTPNLGVASLGPERSFVIADIPGIIEGAAEGAGLGIRFLKHVERTRVLLHVIAPDPDPERDPVKDFDKLMIELTGFDPELAKRPMLVVLGKSDLPEAEDAYESASAAMKERGYELGKMSSATREGLDDVLLALERLLRENPLPTAPRAAPLPSAEDRPAEHPESGYLGEPSED
jgi:GTP-binding protein